jgi:hypothetical protein
LHPFAASRRATLLPINPVAPVKATVYSMESV